MNVFPQKLMKQSMIAIIDEMKQKMMKRCVSAIECEFQRKRRHDSIKHVIDSDYWISINFLEYSKMHLGSKNG